jgi:hypothetical protein
MIDWLKGCVPNRNPFVLKESLRRPEKLSDQLAAVRRQVEERGARWCCLAFDDVTGPAESELHDLYRDLQEDAHLVLFAIMHQAEDVRRARLSAPVPVREFRTAGLASDHAKRFVERRIELFRVDGARGTLCDDLSLFPFDPDDLANAVGPAQAASNGADPGSITLRTLNQILHRGLERAVLENPADIAKLPPEALRAARVKVLELFVAEMQAAA